MQRTAATFLPSLSVDPKDHRPLYRQVYDWFRIAIADGQLHPGQRIPSTRNLAVELGTSRIPVFNAYEQLLAEGYLETLVGSGTCVARSIPDEQTNRLWKKAVRGTGTIAKAGPRLVSRRARTLLNEPPQAWLNSLGAFRVSLPALDQFPIRIWSKLVTRHVRVLRKENMAYGDPMGSPSFREAVAQYLSTVRGVRCNASQILVTTGSQQALQLCAQVLLDPGDRVAIEDPGYPGAQQAFRSAGSELVPVRVNDEGIEVSELAHRGKSIRAVYITPSHQYPLGSTMSATRRMQLLNWATRNGTWIIEDDYDSEYRFDRHPIVCLQGLDRHARVIYIGTLSKVLFPALRLGYVVLPEDLVSAFASAREAADIFSSTLYQSVLTDFIQEGHFARHIRRMRVLYSERRAVLGKAIETHLKPMLRVVGAAAGMHLTALLPQRANDLRIASAAAKRGLSVMPLSSCFLKKPVQPGLILGYGAIDEHEINTAVLELKTIVREQLRTH